MYNKKAGCKDRQHKMQQLFTVKCSEKLVRGFRKSFTRCRTKESVGKNVYPVYGVENLTIGAIINYIKGERKISNVAM